MNMRRMGAIVLKELRQLRRDKLTFAMIAGIPVMELVMFGFAINTDVRGIEAAVLDQANTALSREAMAEITSSQVIEVKYHLDNPQDVDRLLRQGRISAALVVPRDFEARLQRQDRPPLQLVVDGSDQSVQASARQLASYPLPGWENRQAVEVVNLYNPERLAPLNTVPGLLGVILTMTMVLFTAVALVREREHGNLELLIATPVSPWELTIGKVLPFIGIGLVQVTVILVVGHWLFEVPVRGSLLDLYAASVLFISASLALGVWISTLASTQFQAMQMASFTFLPQILLSGFMFPFTGMPSLAQWIAELMPLTHYLRLSRGIMLREAGLQELWVEILILIVFCVALMGMAVARIHKRLD
jgi:ABC-2 type transport system permease protein